MAENELRDLKALRRRIDARSGATLARNVTYKGLLELIDEAIADLEAEE